MALSEFATSLESIGQGATTTLMVIVVAILLMATTGAFFYYYKTKIARYKQFKCVIWQRDGFGQLQQKFDQAGIFVERATNMKRFFMKYANVGLSPDNVPYLVSAKGQKYVYLLQTGLKNFRYLKPRFEETNFTFAVGEEDVNWSVNAYEKQKKKFDIDKIMQYLPFIVLVFISIIILVILLNVMNKLPHIAAEIKEAAKYIAQARSGTTVIQ